MELEKILQGIGFRLPEARVYLATLELGEAIASDIAKKTKMKRPSVYVILRDLIRQGYISSYTRKKVTRFVAQDPQKIITNAKDKAKKAESKLPELEALYKNEDASKPRIQYYEGIDGLIAIMEDTIITGNKTIFAWADVELAWNTLEDYYPTYIRRKNERNVKVDGVFVDNKIGRRFKSKGKIENREVYLIPEKDFPMSNEINIYDDKVAIISHKDLMGVIIQNREIADTQRSIYKIGKAMAKKLDS